MGRGGGMKYYDDLLDAYLTEDVKVIVESSKGIAYLLISEDTPVQVDQYLHMVHYNGYKFELDKKKFSVVV